MLLKTNISNWIDLDMVLCVEEESLEPNPALASS
jgi:hypothetical protein